MKIEKLMTKNVITVELDDSLRLVKKTFDNASFHHILVVEKGVLYGVISDRDLLKTISPNIDTPREKAQDTATLNKKVHQVMSRRPICAKAEQDIFAAIAIINKHNISCLPIVNEKNQPIGILTWRDILTEIEKITIERNKVKHNAHEPIFLYLRVHIGRTF
ncbi:CBS domain-containing protein [Paraglaciecola aquimarina]|uniref:CBS domain-containing protein n=1 Tax=Paraglaciecola aquimarina TaxID=1235557 RepID=A0ABU3SVN8_9ALTE|nr:CBS domain-containing protein [Paraglaciecola aquimarina]MDU0354090.1 CBS domain-containing protein [Paraglaciecola aquimarina]